MADSSDARGWRSPPEGECLQLANGARRAPNETSHDDDDVDDVDGGDGNNDDRNKSARRSAQQAGQVGFPAKRFNCAPACAFVL